MTDRESLGGDPSWPHYFETILEIRDGTRLVRVDLRERLSADLRDELRALFDPPAFGVVTAANPRGRELPDIENGWRSEQLNARLTGDGVKCLSADGVSPDGSHREPGFAVWGPREDVRDLAEQFEQTAFFWFDGTSFWLVATSGVPAPIRLPQDSEPTG